MRSLQKEGQDWRNTRRRSFGPGTTNENRPASIADVARSAGVSIATVSRVMNGRTDGFSAATAKRVLESVQLLNYRPSVVGSALRRGHNPIVGLIVTDLTHAYSGAIAASVEEALRTRGKTMLLCNTGERPERQDEMLSQLRAHLASGVIVLGAVASPGLERALRNRDPVVCVVRRPPGDLAAPFVGIDNRLAAREIAEHFVQRGFGRVAVIHGPLSSSATAERVQGFRDRLREAGLPTRGLKRYQIAASRKELGYALARRVLRGPGLPEAIFCTTDEIAFGVVRRCLEIGIDPARDITLFGFDGNPLNEFLAPWLGTVRVPYEGFGAAVGSLLDRIWAGDRLDREDALILPHQLRTWQSRG